MTKDKKKQEEEEELLSEPEEPKEEKPELKEPKEMEEFEEPSFTSPQESLKENEKFLFALLFFILLTFLYLFLLSKGIL
ncbi:MAG: hypothetical protein R6U26_00850 [Candidatus Undinarchaeales archaeon]